LDVQERDRIFYAYLPPEKRQSPRILAYLYDTTDEN
jgi:hypothetical protein